MVITNSMDILGNSTMKDARKVKVDDMHDVLDVQTASRNASGHKNRASSRAEGTPVC